MSSELAVPAPVETESRLRSLDICRGVALSGILLMNIVGFGGPPYAYSDPTNGGSATGANLWAWITTTMLFEGTQRGLFTILFGAGVILMTRSLEASGRPDASDIFFRRNLWLIVFGIIHAYLLLWTGEILYYYGITALFVYGLRNARARTLVQLAVGGLLFSTAWSGVESYKGLRLHRESVAAEAVKARGDSLTVEQQGAIEGWAELSKGLKPDSVKVKKEMEAKHGSYWDVLKFQAPQVAHFQSWWMYRFFFDWFSMVLLGMVLFRAGLFSESSSSRPLWLMVLVGYGIGLTVNYFEVTHLVREQFSVLAFLRTGVTYDLGRLPLTMGHLGLLLLFARSHALGSLKSGLAAVGRMAFTNYILTSIICAVIFFGFGFGLYGRLQRYELYFVVAGIWVTQLIVSPLWLRRYRFGPLEWGWRWLTYGIRPRFRNE